MSLRFSWWWLISVDPEEGALLEVGGLSQDREVFLIQTETGCSPIRAPPTGNTLDSTTWPTWWDKHVWTFRRTARYIWFYEYWIWNSSEQRFGSILFLLLKCKVSPVLIPYCLLPFFFSQTLTCPQTTAAPPLQMRCLTLPQPHRPTCPPSPPSKRHDSRCTHYWMTPLPWCHRPHRAAPGWVG